MPPPRTYLFVPGDRPERFDKALAAGADRVILDLEDAVGPAHKDTARQHVVQWLKSRGQPATAWVRINAVDTGWFGADLAACADAGVHGVVLPKAEDAAQVTCVTRQLATGAREPAVLPLIETARGLSQAQLIGATPGVDRLLFGSVDISQDLRIDGDTALQPYRAQLVMASCLAGLPPPVDGPSTAIQDESVVREYALRAKSQGFGGVLCIHPRQIAMVAAAFLPTPAEVAWAQAVVAAIGSAGGSAVQVQGKMIDKPLLQRAQDILLAAQPLAA